MKIKEVLYVGVLIALSALSISLFFKAQKKPLESIKYVDRVITLHDTIEVLKPVEIVKERKVSVHDTMWVAVRDTIRQKDTLFVPVQREYRTYGDSRYKAVVSGYEPRLESLEIYQETKVVEVKKRWGLGLQVGYGIGANFKTTPYIGIGISYNLVTW